MTQSSRKLMKTCGFVVKFLGHLGISAFQPYVEGMVDKVSQSLRERNTQGISWIFPQTLTTFLLEFSPKLTVFTSMGLEKTNQLFSPFNSIDISV